MDALVSLSLEALLIITVIVFLGGLIKGFLGFGMPLFATPLLALFMPLLSVIPMMAVPVLASNIYQAKFSRKSLGYLKRFWPLGIGQIIGVSLGVQVLVSADSNVLKICLGIIVLINIALRTTKWKLKIPPNKEGISGPVGGLAAGIVGGTTSFVGPLLVLYLSSLENLKRRLCEGDRVISGRVLPNVWWSSDTGIFQHDTAPRFLCDLCAHANRDLAGRGSAIQGLRGFVREGRDGHTRSDSHLSHPPLID